MNKKLYALALTLLGLAGCGGPRQQPSYVAHKQAVCPTEYPVDGVNQQGDDLDAFVLEEEGENPFSTRTLKNDSLENQAEPKVGDAQADSEKYGLKTVFYGFDERAPKPDQLAKLESNASIIKDLTKKGYTVVVEGHACDSAGSPHYNLVLSEERANNSLTFLQEHGVQVHKNLSVVGRGSEMKLVQSGNRDQQAPNRRVEFYAYPNVRA